MVALMHSEAVVEKHRSSEGAVYKKSMISAVQSCHKSGILLVEMNQVRGPLWLDVMPLFLEASSCPLLWIFLSGKNKNDIPPFVTKWHSLREGALPSDPTDVYPQRLLSPHSGRVVRSMAEGFNHLQQLRPDPLRSLLGDNTNYSCQDLFP